MTSLDWYYVYSPKYEIFHQLMYNALGNCSEFNMQPKFFPQSAFSTLYKEGSTHFLAGSYVKFNVIIDAIKECIGKYIIMSDADLCVIQPEILRSYLENYMTYDIVYMRDNLENTTLNIGFGLIKCTPATLNFFIEARDKIASTGRLDQDIVNELLREHNELLVGMFSTPEMIQSNMYPNFYKEEDKIYVMQMLCSGTTYEHNLTEKLLSASIFFDLRDLESIIPDYAWNNVIMYLKTHNIPNPLTNCKFKFDIPANIKNNPTTPQI